MQIDSESQYSLVSQLFHLLDFVFSHTQKERERIAVSLTILFGSPPPPPPPTTKPVPYQQLQQSERDNLLLWFTERLSNLILGFVGPFGVKLLQLNYIPTRSTWAVYFNNTSRVVWCLKGRAKSDVNRVVVT